MKSALIIAGMCAGVLVVILVISAIFNASESESEDTARLCSTLASEYRTQVAVQAVSDLTPGEDGRAQFDRAEQLARTGCPDRLPLISLARRTVYG